MVKLVALHEADNIERYEMIFSAICLSSRWWLWRNLHSICQYISTVNSERNVEFIIKMDHFGMVHTNVGQLFTAQLGLSDEDRK